MGIIILGSTATITILKNKDNNPPLPVQSDNVIENVDDNQMSLTLYPIPEMVKNSLTNFDAADKYQFENKLDECKEIIDYFKSEDVWLIRSYEDLENIIKNIFTINFASKKFFPA